MSTPPPPFPPSNQPPTPPGFGQPGPGQPGFGPGGGIAPPSWQTGGPGGVPSGLSSPVTPSSSSKKPLVIGAVVVVAILVVIGIVALGGGDDDGDGGSIASAAAARGLDVLVTDGSYEDGYEELRDCPLGDVDDLAEEVSKVIELDDAVLDGDIENDLFDKDDFAAFTSCQITVDGEDDVDGGPYGLYFQAILDPERDYEGYITDLYGDETDVDFEATVEYRGGTVYLFCGEPATEDAGYVGCDADWVNTDDEIALNMFLYGENATTEDAFAGLKAVISTMADNLAELDTEES